MAKTYQHLGRYSDLVQSANRSHKLFPKAKPGRKTQKQVRQALAFEPGPARPRDVRLEEMWLRDGVQGELVSWSVGYGPRTQAWVLKPEEVAEWPSGQVAKRKAMRGHSARTRPLGHWATGPLPETLPGVIALHDHGGFKYYGKEKVADGPTAPNRTVQSFRDKAYGGRAFANELARRGFVVLVPDVFLWGSRKFAPEEMTDWDRIVAKAFKDFDDWADDAREIRAYNAVAVNHENTVAKYCTLLGTTLAGVVSYEDRVAAAYLASRKDVASGGIGCVGLSGGGLRAALLQATCDDIRASVVVGMMSSSEGLLDHNVVSHTWLLFPSEWSRHGDWADLVSCRAPSPLMVQYDEEDSLFSPEGMKAAHRRIAGHYRAAGKSKNYAGRFYPGPHKFDVAMQDEAFDWLENQMIRR